MIERERVLNTIRCHLCAYWGPETTLVPIYNATTDTFDPMPHAMCSQFGRLMGDRFFCAWFTPTDTGEPIQA